MSALFGSLLLLLPMIGSMGLQYSNLYIGQPNKLWTARRIFIVYALVSLLVLIAEIYYIYEAFLAYKEMTNAKAKINSFTDDYFGSISSNDIPFGVYEKFLSDQFNIFYWGATQGCTNSKYALFWTFIGNNCKASINMANCKKCNTYSVQICEVDYETCSSSSSSSIACPYTACRSNIITYIVNNIMPVSYWVLAFTIIQGLLIIIAIVIAVETKTITQNVRRNRNSRNRSPGDNMRLS